MIQTKTTVRIKEHGVPPILTAVQGDTGRSVIISLSDMTIPDGSTATVYVAKPSGNAIYNYATIEGDTVVVDMTAQMLAEVGEMPMQVRLENDGVIVTSFSIILKVYPFEGIEAVESTTEMNIFDEAVEIAREQLENAIDPTLTEQNMAAEAKATGELIAEVDFTDRIGKGTGARGLSLNNPNNEASGAYGLAEGSGTKAQGSYSHAEGYYAKASGDRSHAEGQSTTASGANSHAEGQSTTAVNRSQHVFGEYNEQDPSGNAGTAKGTYVEIVGNGTMEMIGGVPTTHPSNARTLDWDGNEVLAGKLTIGTAPTSDMDAATKKYVDDAVGEIEGWTATDPDDDGNIIITF